MSVKEKLYRWLDDRVGLEPLVHLAGKKTVPYYHRALWYYFGGVTMFLFLVQVATGVLLLFYYRPGADSAWESVKFITTKVPFGWLIRSVHSWSANLMILFALIHLFSVFFMRAYRKPRELTWLTGFLLLGMAMGFGFSGYLLPWDELAYFATKVGTDIAGVIPVVGHYVLMFLRGGEDVTEATLSRFFAIHIFILPAISFSLLFLHLLLVQKQGMSAPASWEALPPEKKKVLPFVPNFMLRDVFVWMLALNVLALLAVFFPWELGPKADPFAPAPAGIRPEWYFMFMFQSLKLLPAHLWIFEGEMVGVMFFNLVFLVVFLVPFLDRRHDQPRSWLFAAAGVIGIAYMVVMTIWGYTT